MLDSGKEMCAVFYDIQKAFDTILMQKLQYAGLNNHILHWICSYLTDREQNVLKTMLISRKRIHLKVPPLLVNSHTLKQVECFKYLGLLLTSNLSCSPHIETACSKARKLLGMIYRHFSEHSSPDTQLHLYKSMVRPHLEYASQVWDPY